MVFRLSSYSCNLLMQTLESECARISGEIVKSLRMNIFYYKSDG